MTVVLLLVKTSGLLQLMAAAEKLPDWMDLIKGQGAAMSYLLKKLYESKERKDSDTNFENWAKFVRSGMGQLPTLKPLGP